MKSTGVIRRVDELGRIVIPIELRRTHGINERDPMEIFVDGERILLNKYEPACSFCGKTDDMMHFRGKNICTACVEEMQQQY